MAIYNSKRHDFAITDVGSAGAGTDLIGFMLDETREGVPAYFELDASLLADQFYTGQASVINIDPKKKIILSQADWRAGFGLEIYDANDPTRYRKSTMDMSNRGMGICGQKFTTVTKPDTISTAKASLANTDMEANSTWLGGGSQSSAQAHGGTYSWTISSVVEVYQDATTWDNAWRSRVFTFVCWVYTTASSGGRIGINDGVGTSYSSYHSGATGWEQLTVNKTLDASATRLRVLLVSDDSAAKYWDDCDIGSPVAGTSIDFAEFNDELYMASGSTLSKLNAGGTAFDAVAGLPTTITDLEVFTDDKLYICLGFSDAYWEMDTSENLLKNYLANNTMKFMTTVFTTADTMYASDSNNTIRSTTAPKDGGTAWSSTTTVGQGYHNITKLIGTFTGALYVMKEDKPYYLDGSGNVQQDLAPELVSETASTSGKNAHVYLGRIYIPAGDQTLLETDGTPANNVNRDPASYATNLSDYVGRVQALASDGRWLFAIVDNSGSVEILKGRNEVIGGTTSWVWHPIGTLTLTDCETAFVSTVVSKRLWIASTSVSETETLRPNAAGDETNILQQIPDSTLHYDKVDEVIPDETDTIVYILTDNNTWFRDLYNIENHSVGSGTINSVKVYVRAKGTRTPNQTSLKIVVKSGTTTDEGSAQTIPTSYANYSETWATNPDTSSAWTWNEIDSLQVGPSIRRPYNLDTSGIEVTQVYVEVDYNPSLSYMPLPTKYGDVTNDSNRNFLTGTLFETPLLHGNFKADNKAWLKLTLTMGHTYNAGRYFTVKYKELGGSFVSISGNFAGSSTSMVDSKVIDTTNKPFSTMLGLQFTAVTDDTNETPMLLSYEVEALPYFKIQRLIYCVFNVADNVKNNEGGHEGNMYERWKSTLDNARSNAVWPVTIKDIDGTEIKVMFLPVPESVQRLLITKKTKNRKQERQYHALMLVIPDS